MSVRVGASPPLMPGTADNERIASTLARMHDAGVDHVVVGDHVSFFVGLGFDGLIQATALASLHPSMPVYTSVYLLPLRHPVTVARQLSTLAGIAPGRLMFGVGIGGEDRHEVEICGVDPATRGARMDESLRLLRSLQSDTTTTFHGQFFDVVDAIVLPQPDPPIPLIVGGRSHAAVRRAGRFGDGWLGIWVSPERFAQAVEHGAEEANAVERSDAPTRHGMTVWCGLGDRARDARSAVSSAMEAVYQQPFARFERYCPFGRPAEVAEFLTPYAAAGCRDFNLLARGADAEATVDAVGEVKRLLVREFGPTRR